MTIGGYFINDFDEYFYWWILVFINGYYISAFNGYSINGFDEYFIGGYWCLLKVIILMFLMIILLFILMNILLVDIGAY
jgi:hypothetical protein